MATVSKKKEVEEENKLTKSKKMSTDLSYNLQLLSERVKASIQSVDTSDVEDVEHCNNIIKLLNDLLAKISTNQNTEYTPFDEIPLTDEDGNIVTEYKDFVVGYYFLENNKESYYKCRIVSARTSKEAIFKYQKKVDIIDDSVSCFGEYIEDAPYNEALDDMEKIV